MRVVVADIQSYGYLGYHALPFSDIKVFGNMQSTEDWLGTYYHSAEKIADHPNKKQYVYHCITTNHEVEYITLYDREIES